MESLLSEGRTLFLVSHSEKDLKRFGTRGLYLRHGELVMDGPMDDVLARYNEDQGPSGQGVTESTSPSDYTRRHPQNPGDTPHARSRRPWRRDARPPRH